MGWWASGGFDLRITTQNGRCLLLQAWRQCNSRRTEWLQPPGNEGGIGASSGGGAQHRRTQQRPRPACSRAVACITGARRLVEADITEARRLVAARITGASKRHALGAECHFCAPATLFKSTEERFFFNTRKAPSSPTISFNS